MSTFLEIMGTLILRDTPEIWPVLCRLEKDLFIECGDNGVVLEVADTGGIEAYFDFAGVCGMTSRTNIENDLDLLSPHTVGAAYLTMGWDNERDRVFFGPDDGVRQLKSQLAREEIARLQRDLTPADSLAAAHQLLSVSA